MISFVQLAGDSTFATDGITKVSLENPDALAMSRLAVSAQMKAAGYTDAQIAAQTTTIVCDPKHFRGLGQVAGVRRGETITIGGKLRDCWGVPL